MLIKTHYSISIFFILLFLPVVENKIIFSFFTILGTLIPDVDARFSTIGRKFISRILQFFTKHRGMIHSFTFLLSITAVLVSIFPRSAFGFFLGYGLHLLADSFTIDGIMPFYPSKKITKGFIKTGGKIEYGILIGFIVASVFLLIDRIHLFF